VIGMHRASPFTLFRAAALAALAGALAAAVAPDARLAAQTPRRHFLWKVDVDGRGRGGYLMGSLHVLTPEYYPLPAAIIEAFERSTTLVEEIDLGELELPATRALILQRALLPGNATLDGVVSSETSRTIAERAATTGLPAPAIKRMKPWMVAVTLLGAELKKGGFDPGLGLDRYFFDLARKRGLKVVGLETAAYQIERFDGLSPALQEAMLLETLEDVDRQRANAKRLADAWATGDTATLEAVLVNEFRKSPELYARLLIERNRNWVAPLERCFASAPPCFAVVGAAHLLGPDSLVRLLSERGYTVVQQ
jgi:uncharacterized protein YbaP (TraB family)